MMMMMMMMLLTDVDDRFVKDRIKRRVQLLHDVLQQDRHAKLYRLFQMPHVVGHLKVDDLQPL